MKMMSSAINWEPGFPWCVPHEFKEGMYCAYAW